MKVVYVLLALAFVLYPIGVYQIGCEEDVFILNFEGWSMGPSLRPGDTLLCLKIPFENLKVGDIVAHYNPIYPDHPLVVHRVIEVSGGRIRTKGDNNPDPDRYNIDNSLYVGKVIGVLFTSSKTWRLENCG
jgi:signal peptidase I